MCRRHVFWRKSWKPQRVSCADGYAALLQPRPVSSCLSTEKRGMDRIMLEVVVSGCVTTPADILKFVRCTLLSAEHAAAPADGASAPAAVWHQAVAEGCRKSLRALGDQGFIEWAAAPEGGGGGGAFRPLKLGRAAVAAGLQPLDALMLHEDVQTLANAVNLESDLHLMFLVAPVAPSPFVDWTNVSRVLSLAHGQRAVVRDVCRLSGIDLAIAQRFAKRQKKGWHPEVRPAPPLSPYDAQPARVRSPR